MIIKWCLSIKLRSSSSYNALSNSGVLVLPSDRTLRDYTHFVKAQAGFSPEMGKQLQRKAKFDSIPLYHRNFCLVFDEVRPQKTYCTTKTLATSLDLSTLVKIII